MKQTKLEILSLGMEGGDIKRTLDGASFSLNTLWAQREAVIAAASLKDVLKLRSHHWWLGLSTACPADFTLLEDFVGMGCAPSALKTGFCSLWGSKLPTLQTPILACQGGDCAFVSHIAMPFLCWAP